jgi:hypothetical protein
VPAQDDAKTTPIAIQRHTQIIIATSHRLF